MNKTIEKIKRQYSKMTWYKQGAAVRPLYVGYPWEACLGLTVKGRRVNFSYLPFAVYLENDFFDVYFPRENMERMSDFYYGQEKVKPGFAAALKKHWQKTEVAKLEKIIHKIEKEDMGLFNNKELIFLFEQFTDIYVAFWKEAIFLDSFDVTSDTILEKALEKENKKISDKDIVLLTSPRELSWMQKEKEAALKLARQKESNPGFIKKVQAHAAAYHWIFNDYAVIHSLDWRFFLLEIKKLRKDKRLYQKEKHAIDLVKSTAKRQQALSKKLKFSSNLVVTTDFLLTLASWRDWRKAYNQKANGVLYKFMQEFNGRTGFSKDEIEYLWWWEILKIFKLKKQDARHAWARHRGLFSVGDLKKREKVFLGKDAGEMARFMQARFNGGNSLSGRPVSGGMVQGKVKIVRTQHDFCKMKRGDILVAPNTRPEYLPIMKIAGAIISVEGGLTCHTAIVARELKIPAVIGVQGAMSALKDGQLVEVDADKGVVRKIPS